MKKKFTVVWLCMFRNSEINEKLSVNHLSEMSPWINNLIEIFKKNAEIELHIVSPNIYNNLTIDFKSNGIHYHFYRVNIFHNSRVERKLKFLFNLKYFWVSRAVKNIIDQIKPDVVHLHGAENPVVAVGVLKIINNYKVIVTIQGFISQETRLNHYLIRLRKKYEYKVLSLVNNYGVRTKEMIDYIKDNFNPTGLFHWHLYPITRPRVCSSNSTVKEYDFVFFARISPENGIYDLFKAISLIKEQKSDVNLIVIGPVGINLHEINTLLSDYAIFENVTFKGFFNTQQDAYNHVLRAKIDVLPTYYDIIPGSILECMYMGIPVIANAVGGIPELNQHRESVVLVEKGDVDLLAKTMIELLKNQERMNELAKNAKITCAEYFDSDKIRKQILEIYSEL